MKRVVSSSIVTFLVLIAAAAVFLYFRNFRGEQGDPLSAIPSDAVMYLVADPAAGAIESLMKPDAWGAWSAAPALATLQKRLNAAHKEIQESTGFGQEIGSGAILISVHVTGAGTFDFLFLKGISPGVKENIGALLMEASGPDATESKREYDGNIIHEMSLTNGRVFTWATVKGVFMGSFTSFLVEDALRQQKVGKSAVWRSASIAGGNPEMNINFNNLPAFFSLFTGAHAFSGYSMIRNVAGWFGGSVYTAADRLSIDGILESQDTMRFMNCLKGQEPVKALIPSTLPAKTAAVLWYGTSDFDTYLQRLDRFHRSTQNNKQYSETIRSINKKFKTDIFREMTEWVSGEYALVVTEPSSSNYDNSLYAVFNTDHPEKAAKKLTALTAKVDKKLGESTRNEEYQGHVIKLIRLNDVIPAIYGDHFKRLSRLFYTISGNQVIFANQASSLRNYIDEIEAGHTFAPYVKGLIPGKGTNFMLLIRPEASLPIFGSAANSTWKGYIEKYREAFARVGLFSFVVTVSNDRLLANARLDLGKSARTMARLQFSVESDSSVTLPPLLIPGDSTSGGKIVFQDDAGVLYMADNAGNILWRTKLENAAMGRIYAVDYFRNGNTQFLFNTRTHIYLVDDEGKPVGNFPMRLPAPATNAMTLSITEGTREQVIYIACENRRIYAYTISGRPLQGWNFQSTTGTVTTPVHAFVSAGKRYLLISDREGSVTLVNSFGDITTGLSQGFVPAENAFIYTDSVGKGDELLVTSDVNGNIIKVNPNGSVTQLPVNAAGDGHGFLYEDVDGDGKRDYVFANGKEIIAYDPSMTLLYRKVVEGIVSGGIFPVILPDGTRGYAASSADENKTWLFNLNGEELEGFPVRGSMGFTIGELNSDGRHNLITGSKNKGINVYSLD